MCQQILNEQLKSWDRKSCLRYLYKKWFRQINSYLVTGAVLEVGTGIGRYKENNPGVIALDIEKTIWTDIVGDAQSFPFRTGSLGNIVLFDVLHHIPEPKIFFKEAERILKRKGRIIIVEPYISPVSYFVYKYFHPEKVDTSCDPLGEKQISSQEPFDSNQAVATILFFKRLNDFQKEFPQFKIILKQKMSFAAYPLSRGFGGKNILPDGIISSIADIEHWFKWLAPLAAFRTFVVMEK